MTNRPKSKSNTDTGMSNEYLNNCMAAENLTRPLGSTYQQSLLNSMGGVGILSAWVRGWHGSNFAVGGRGGMGL